MELLQLRYFFDSARTENFTKTAEKYMVPTTSVSAAIRRLEKELGCELFDRHSNRITLNQNGRKLQCSLGIVFDELDQATNALSSGETDDVEIKLLIKSLRLSITEAIIKYRKMNPNVRFKTVFDFADQQFDDYDLIIDEKKDIYGELERFELCSVRVRMKVSADSPLCGRYLTMKQLRNQPFITMGEDSNLHKILLDACKKAGFVPNIVMETNDAQCYGKCITEGVGIGLSRERSNQPGSGTAYLNVTDFEVYQTFYGYYHKNPTKDAVRDFIDYMKSGDI